MHLLKLSFRIHFVAACAMLSIVAPLTLVAAEPSAASASGSGTFVSFHDGTLTIKSPAGLVEYREVNDSYRSFQNNEDGPGSKLVDTEDALSRVAVGTVFQVDVKNREISFGLDHRTIGKFESFDDGQLSLLAADAPTGFIQKPAGRIVLKIEQNTPVLESVAGDDFKFAGLAGEVLKTVKRGALVTARSEYDPNVVEVIQIGQPRRAIERYIGQSRGTVRGKFVSFNNGILRIRGSGVTPLAANDYERVMNFRIGDNVPIAESIDGDKYQPATSDALATLKEGSIVTIRKVEEVILEVQIGVAKKD